MQFSEYYNYDWSALAQEVYNNNHQWWHDLKTGEKLVRKPKTLLALMSSELSEGLEGVRKNKKDDHLPNRDMIEVELADHLIRTLDFIVGMDYPIPDDVREVFDCYYLEGFVIDYFEGLEISEALYDLEDAMHAAYANGNTDGELWFAYILTICGFAIKYDLDLMGAMTEKLEYNKHREDHKKEARLAQGGKVF